MIGTVELIDYWCRRGDLTPTGLPLPDFEFSDSIFQQRLPRNTPQNHSSFDFLAAWLCSSCFDGLGTGWAQQLMKVR
jgi:hypothetical protein